MATRAHSISIFFSTSLRLSNTSVFKFVIHFIHFCSRSISASMSQSNYPHELSRRATTEKSGRLHPKLLAPRRKPGHRQPSDLSPTIVPITMLHRASQNQEFEPEAVAFDSYMNETGTGTVAPRATVRRTVTNTLFTGEGPDIAEAAKSSGLIEPQSGTVSTSTPFMQQQRAISGAPVMAHMPQGCHGPMGADYPFEAPSTLAPSWYPDTRVSMAPTTMRQAEKLRDLDKRVTQLEKMIKYCDDECVPQKRQKKGN